MERNLSYEFLQDEKNEFSKIADVSQRLLEHCSYSRRTHVFLSHKHDESPLLIKQIRGFFASLNADLYIDWQDKDMPKVTNMDTARKLKEKIKTTDKFVILATPKSIESIWIPWEIGLADQIKGYENIAILPIVHDNEAWVGREYYRLYSKIQNVKGKWLVLAPDYDFFGVELVEWLQK